MAINTLKPVHGGTVTNLRGQSAHPGNSAILGNPVSELETLFLASRQVEASLNRERNENNALHLQLNSTRDKHAQEIARARQHLQTLTERDATLIKQLKAAYARVTAFDAETKQLQAQNARLRADADAQARKLELDLTASRTALDHMRGHLRQHEDTIRVAKSELERSRQELERAQGEVLEREHAYQAATLNFQGRDQNQQTTISALKDQLKQLQTELTRAKARWLETERLRHEAESARADAELRAQGKSPSQEKLRKMEDANQFLQERLAEEKRKRKDLEKAMPSADMGQEMNRLRSALSVAEERLALTEAQLSKASAEAALMRAVHNTPNSSLITKTAPSTQAATREFFSPQPIDFDLLEKLALPGYPIQDEA